MSPKSADKKKRVRFELQAETDSEVYVAGSFNKWNPRKNKLKCKDGLFATSMLLSPGKHEYKFIIDDAWCVDPDCSEWIPNEHGSINSVRVVG